MLRIEKIDQSVKIMKVIINYIVLPTESVTGNFIDIDLTSGSNIVYQG